MSVGSEGGGVQVSAEKMPGRVEQKAVSNNGRDTTPAG